MSSAGKLRVYRQRESLGAAGDLELGLRLLEGTRRFAMDPNDPEATPATLRIYRPQPTLAFGQRDSRLPGFGAAQETARQQGYAPLVRRAGGRAAAYNPGSLVIDHVEPDADPIRESRARFISFGELFTEALTSIGIQAQVGPIPGEYCYGEHSVHGIDPEEPDRRIKLIGTAQRQIATGWLFSSSIIVDQGPSIRRVLTDAYAAMELEWDPLTAGAVTELYPQVTVGDVEDAILGTYAQYWELQKP